MPLTQCVFPHSFYVPCVVAVSLSFGKTGHTLGQCPCIELQCLHVPHSADSIRTTMRLGIVSRMALCHSFCFHRWIEEHLPTEVADRCYFFNSFFYKKLTEKTPRKGKGSQVRDCLVRACVRVYVHVPGRVAGERLPSMCRPCVRVCWVPARASKGVLRVPYYVARPV